MSADELLAQYEATGDEEAFVGAETLHEQALAEAPDNADLHMSYGYVSSILRRSPRSIAAPSS